MSVYCFFSLTLAGGNKISFYSFRNEEPRPYPRRNPKGKPLRQLSQSRALINASQPASCFDISRDSQLAAIASGRSIQIWQINVPQMQQSFEEHTGVVTCVSFSPNCEFFASGAEDKTVIIWNLVFSLVVTNFKVISAVICNYCGAFRIDGIVQPLHSALSTQPIVILLSHLNV